MSLLYNLKERAIYLFHKYTTPFKLKKQNAFPKKEDKNEIRLFAIVRNEALWMPYFLDYYFQRGVDRMFILDNDDIHKLNEIEGIIEILSFCGFEYSEMNLKAGICVNQTI